MAAGHSWGPGACLTSLNILICFTNFEKWGSSKEGGGVGGNKEIARETYRKYRGKDVKHTEERGRRKESGKRGEKRQDQGTRGKRKELGKEERKERREQEN